MFKGYLLILSGLLVSCSLSAQSTTNGVWNRAAKGVTSVKSKAGKKVSALKTWKNHLQTWGLDSSYHHSLSIGGRLNSDGWSGGVFYGQKRNNHSISIWQLTFSEVKAEKETKQQGSNNVFPSLGATTPYIFGKVNNLYALRVGYGRELILLPSVVENNISIGFRYSIGMCVTLIKPYYLKLIIPDYSKTPTTAIKSEESYNENNKDIFLNKNLILGKAAWSRGLDEINYVPGIYGEAEITVVAHKHNTFIQTVLLGINASIHTQDLPIMADAQVFRGKICLFVSLELGKRW